MTNLEKFNHTFEETFGVTEDQLSTLCYQGIAEWDSVGHMQLIASLEDTFDIVFDPDDIIGLSTYDKVKEAISRYGVEL